MCSSRTDIVARATDEPREREEKADHECNESPHVHTLEVEVMTAWRVVEKVRQVDVALADEEVVGQHDSDDGGLKNRVAAEELEKAICCCDNSPVRSMR